MGEGKRPLHFIIVGAMKSGTTTLAHYLSQHSQVYMPGRELHFFDGRGAYDEFWQKGIEWYEQQFAEAAPGAVCGKKTPTYSYPSRSAPPHQGGPPKRKAHLDFSKPD